MSAEKSDERKAVAFFVALLRYERNLLQIRAEPHDRILRNLTKKMESGKTFL